MKILLIYPTSHQGLWPRGRFYSHWVPSPLSQMAAELLKNGHDVKIHLREQVLVQNGFDWPEADSELVKLLNEFQPDMVGFSIVTPMIRESARLIKIVRSTLGKQVKILAGGPHPTALPDHAFEIAPQLDAVIMFEGEQTIVELASGKPPEDTDGTAFINSDGLLIKNSPRQRIKNLDSISPPAWQLFDMNFHCQANRWMLRWLKMRAINIRTSRGCPNVCSFCAGHVTVGKGVRFHSADYVIEQIQRAAKDYKIQGILFEDETLAANRGRLSELCEKLRNNNLTKNLKWACCLRTDQADKAMLDEMKRSGCIQAEFGFESGSDSMLDAISKNSSLDINRRAVELTRAAGIRIYADILFNIPGETENDIAQTVKFLRWAKPDIISAAVLTPLPGTALYNGLTDKQKMQYCFEDTAWPEKPHQIVNFTAMPDDKFNKLYRRLHKYFITPTLHRQLLRDCEPSDKQYYKEMKRKCRNFRLKHPLRAARLPI